MDSRGRLSQDNRDSNAAVVCYFSCPVFYGLQSTAPFVVPLNLTLTAVLLQIG